MVGKAVFFVPGFFGFPVIAILFLMKQAEMFPVPFFAPHIDSEIRQIKSAVRCIEGNFIFKGNVSLEEDVGDDDLRG